METKKCSKCGRTLPLSEFNKNKNCKDGLQSTCRECVSQYNKKRYAANKEVFKAKVKAYQEARPERVLETRLSICKKKPTHKNAYKVIEAALAAGVIEKPHHCSVCGCSDTEHRMEAHHCDYTKPLDVVWLCTPCHYQADKARREHEGLKGHACGKPVLMIRDGEVLCRFDTIADAARAVGVSPSKVSECLSGKNKTSGGFEWAYEEDE